MSLAASGSNWKAAKRTIAGRGIERPRLLPGQLDLLLLERRMLRTERDDDALRLAVGGALVAPPAPFSAGFVSASAWSQRVRRAARRARTG